MHTLRLQNTPVDELDQVNARFLVLDMLSHHRLDLTLAADLHELVFFHVALDGNAGQGEDIVHVVAVHPALVVGLIPRSSSGPSVACIGDRNRTVKIDKGHFYWPLSVKNDVFRLQISVNEPKSVQLLQSSDYLKQYIIKLAVVAVLSEVRS
jgi:hypothetical protein